MGCGLAAGALCLDSSLSVWVIAAPFPFCGEQCPRGHGVERIAAPSASIVRSNVFECARLHADIRKRALGGRGASSICQIATAFVGKQRFENVIASGAPGFKTRATSASTSPGRVRY